MTMNKRGGAGGGSNESRMMNGDYERNDDSKQKLLKNVILCFFQDLFNNSIALIKLKLKYNDL